MFKGTIVKHNFYFKKLFLLLGFVFGASAMADQFDDALTALNKGEHVLAYKLLIPLAERGELKAQNIIGYMYQRGTGVARDDLKAAKWWRLAAEQGFADAQNNIGTILAEGRGVPQNDIEAAKWYRRAAEQGYSVAQSNLGAIYGQGLGVKQDWTESAKWYRLAAEQGDPLGQSNLGVAYANAQGVLRDFVQAYAWYSLAIDSFPSFDQFGRDRALQNRDVIEKYMSPDQITKAKVFVENWKKKFKRAD
jgi:TPR repeat protein